MKRTSVSLLFALAALQNGALAVPAPQIPGLPALPNINPPTQLPSLPTEALSSIVDQISTISENVGPLPTENLPVPPTTDILSELPFLTSEIGPLPTELLPTESLPPMSVVTDEIAFYTEVLPYIPDEERNSFIGEILPTEDIMSFLSQLPSLTSQLGSMPTDYSDPYTEGEIMTDTEVPATTSVVDLPETSTVELPETSTVELPPTSLVTTAPSTTSTVTPTSTQEESPKATSSFVPKAPVPTSISNNPLETQFNKFANLQKTLNTSLNEQGTKLTVQVSSSSSGQNFRGDFNLQTEGTPHAGASFYRAQNDTESFFKFRVGLLKLVELNTVNNWNLASSENVINFANLSSNFWSPIKIADVPNDKNVAIKSISTTFSMTNPTSNSLIAPKDISLSLKDAIVMEEESASSGNITVNFEAYMVNDTVTLDNVTHTPKALKYTLKISNFPFRYPDSQLAIVKGVYFKKGDESEYSSAASSLSIGGGKGRFNWTNAVTLDSVASVLSTDSSITVEDVPNANPPESVAYVAFKTNGKFNSLVWDPEVILEEEKLVQSFNQTDAKSGVEKLFSTGSSMVVMVVASITMMLLNVF